MVTKEMAVGFFFRRVRVGAPERCYQQVTSVKFTVSSKPKASLNSEMQRGWVRKKPGLRPRGGREGVGQRCGPECLVLGGSAWGSVVSVIHRHRG